MIRFGCVSRPFFSYGLLMAQRTDLARGRDVVARWCVLAEQRLDYLTNCSKPAAGAVYHSESHSSKISGKPSWPSKTGAIW